MPELPASFLGMVKPGHLRTIVALEAELIARFWHDYSSRMPHDSHAVGEQWAAACLRYRGYHVRDAAHSLRNYLDWRRVFELE